jgi:hypothetical protein
MLYSLILYSYYALSYCTHTVLIRGYTSDATDNAVQANIVAAGYGK